MAPWFIPQFTPRERINAFYTFSARYLLTDKNKTWKDFYNEFRKRGGDGFYGSVMNPYLEPSLLGKSNSYQKYQRGLCPNAELIQQQSMCFKTNYRNIDNAKAQVDLLADLIKSWG